MNTFTTSTLFKRVALAFAAATLALAGCNGGSSSPGGSAASGGGGGDPTSPSVSITVNPVNVALGGTTNISWTSTAATACQPLGSNWPISAIQAPSGNVNTNALTTAGVITFPMLCTGPTGSAETAGVVTVGGSGSTVSTTDSIGINPSTIVVGQVATLTWTSANATGCTISINGANTSSVAPNVVGQASTPAGLAAGSYLFDMQCTGGEGTTGTADAHVTLTVVATSAPPAPIVSVSASPSSIVMGATSLIAWSTQNATSCNSTVNGGSEADGVGTAGSVPTQASLGVGAYVFTFTCTGPGGTSSNSATLNVGAPVGTLNGPDCGLAFPTSAFQAPAATTSQALGGLCLLGCGVSQPDNVIDNNLANFATISIPVGVLSTVSLTVNGGVGTIAPGSSGRVAGFVVVDPSAVLTLALAQNIEIDTVLNGVTQESTVGSNPLVLNLLGLLGNDTEFFLNVVAHQPFDSLRITDGTAVGVLNALAVYNACVAKSDGANGGGG